MEATNFAGQNNYPSPAVMNSFYALQFTGGIGFAVILFTALLSRDIKRSSTWISFCASWTISCFSYVLLVGQPPGHTPQHAICLTQAALVYSCPPLMAFTILALAIYMWFTVHFILSKKPLETGFITTIALVVSPYLVWLVIFLGILLFGFKHPDMVRRSPNGTYCSLNSTMPMKIASLCVIICTFMTVLIEVVIGRKMYRNRDIFRSSRDVIRMVFRVMAFTVIGAVGLGLGIAYILAWEHGPAFDIIMAAIPVTGVFIFGSQTDLVAVWMFWKPLQTKIAGLLPSDKLASKV